MAPSGQLTSSALQALIQDGNLAGSWTLDTARSEVRLKSRSMWGLAPVNGVFREVVPPERQRSSWVDDLCGYPRTA